MTPRPLHAPDGRPVGSLPDPHSDLDRVLAALPPDEAERLRETWALAAYAAPTEASYSEVVARTEQVLSHLAAQRDAPSTPARFRDRPARRLAAHRRRAVWALTSLAGAFLLAFLWVQQPVVVTASAGERLTVQLADGSAVTLNSGSTLRRTRLFGRIGATRTVALEGEAYFDVVEADKPFVVQTFDAEVTVLGTQFGVRAWPDDPDAATTVALVSGRIHLASADRPGNALLLSPGETGRVAEDAPAPILADDEVEMTLAWRVGDLVYKDRPLGVILNDLERRFSLRVSSHPTTLNQRRVSVALRNPPSADAVVRDLALALELRYRARADGFELYDIPAASELTD